jgi:hypothetical protein
MLKTCKRTSMRTSLITFILLGSFILTAQAATYYVSSSTGSDSWPGTEAQPWASLAKVASLNPYQPGDKIFLKRGDVWNEYLYLNCSGTPTTFIELAAYGTGARPMIRRNNVKEDRCLRWDGGYVKVSSITVRDAGMGLIAYQIEDCIAITIKGLYGTPQPEGNIYSQGLASAILNFSEGFGASAIDGAWMDRVYIHDSVNPGTSYAGTEWGGSWWTDGLITRCLYDRCVYSAASGTSALILGGVRYGTIDNCIIRNTPHAGSADECGIDFEDDNQFVTIQNTVFENNAGPAIEFLRGGQTLTPSGNVEIKNCKFIKNNWARTQNEPAEIQVVNWTSPNRPFNVTIHDNEYTLTPNLRKKPNVIFFGGDGDKSGCTLWNNLSNPTISYNHEPNVFAGADKQISANSVLLSDATASDDGAFSVKWEQLSGPSEVTFANPNALNTTAYLPAVGTYELRLIADDGTFWKTDYLTVTVLESAIFYIESVAYPGHRLQAAGNDYNGLPNTHDVLFSGWGPYNEQQFKKVDAGSGSFYLESIAFPGYRLQASASLYNGAPGTHDLFFSSSAVSTSQRFKKVDATGGLFYIESIAFPGYRLQAAGNLYAEIPNTHDVLLSNWGPYNEQQFKQIVGP